MPRRSWTRSRKAGLWRNFRADQAAQVLTQSYESRSGEEALFRALLAERDMDGEGAAFWICVYERISPHRHPRI